MAPGSKPGQDVRLELDNNARAEHRRAANQGQGRPVSGAQVGNDQEGDEENRRRTEVAHQPQQADAHAGEHDEQRQVSFAKQPLQRGGSGKDVTDLGNFRGLERKPADRNPVHRAVFGLPQHQGDAQKANGPRGHEPADLLHPLQVPQKQSQHNEEHQTQ